MLCSLPFSLGTNGSRVVLHSFETCWVDWWVASLLWWFPARLDESARSGVSLHCPLVSCLGSGLVAVLNVDISNSCCVLKGDCILETFSCIFHIIFPPFPNLPFSCTTVENFTGMAASDLLKREWVLFQTAQLQQISLNSSVKTYFGLCVSELKS